ncbi:MAG TPA: hypothetical protein VJT31_42580 [Rugosimonospora sp.]|nr:hypothetical protein [Rugosimonospora sp.]
MTALATRRQRRAERQEIAYGRVAKIESSYPRQVAVPPPILLVVLLAASLVRTFGRMLASLLGGSPGGSAPGWKALRKGPEFLVTPVLVRDPDNRLVPVEIHGHMSGSALIVGDRVRARLRWYRDASLPPRAVDIENLTTGRMLRPRGATLWSHLGIGLLLQALLGLVLFGLTVFCLVGWR